MLTIQIKSTQTIIRIDPQNAGQLLTPIRLPDPPSAALTLEQVDRRITAAIAAIAQLPTQAETDLSLTVGQPVYLQSNGRLDLAQADAIGTALVCGLALSDTLPGFSAKYSADGLVQRDNWTAVAGTSDLAPGSTYYLRPEDPGKLTAIAPTLPGQIVAVVGIALNSSTLAIEIQPLILL